MCVYFDVSAGGGAGGVRGGAHVARGVRHAVRARLGWGLEADRGLLTTRRYVALAQELRGLSGMA